LHSEKSARRRKYLDAGMIDRLRWIVILMRAHVIAVLEARARTPKSVIS
jgi:hypothetical protein